MRPAVGEAVAVVVRELVAVAVALADLRRAVRFGGDACLVEHARIRAEAHRAALVLHAALVGHEVDDGARACLDRTRSSSRPRVPRRGARTRRRRAACRGRCRRTGSCSRARTPIAAIFPSVPRSPKPPGTSTASRCDEERARRRACSICSESMYSSSTIAVVLRGRRGRAPRGATCTSPSGARTCRRCRSSRCRARAS